MSDRESRKTIKLNVVYPAQRRGTVLQGAGTFGSLVTGEAVQERRTSTRREQAALSARLRSEGKTWVDIAAVFRERYRLNGRVAIRLARQLSQKDVADAWNARWPDEPKSFKNVSSWELWPNGGHQPSLVTLRRLAEIYECAVSDLVADYADYRHLDSANQAKGVTERAKSRRPFTAVSHVSGLEYTKPAGLVKPSITAGDGSAEKVMEGFRVADRQVGGGHLYPAVVGYLQTAIAPRVFDVVHAAKDNEELFTSAGALSEMAGWMAHDAGDDITARRHFQRSLELTNVGKDRQLKAHVLASMSHLCLHDGDPEEAIRLAREGRDALADDSVNPGLAARLFSMEARGLAELNRSAECDEILALAARALARPIIDEPSPWVSSFDEGSLASEITRCMTRLSRFSEVESYARQILTLRPGGHTRSRAFGQLMLIGTLIAQGRPIEACTIAQDVLDTTHSLGSYLVLKKLHNLRDLLAPFSGDEIIAEFLLHLDETLQVRSTIYRQTVKSTIPSGRVQP
jgi:transcriptional regulator with XRE-family HTH domain